MACPIKLHAAQGLPELALIQERYGKRSIELLGEIGFLGPKVGIPHVYYIGGHNGVEASGADELALLARLRHHGHPLPDPGAPATPARWTRFDGYLQGRREHRHRHRHVPAGHHPRAGLRQQHGEAARRRPDGRLGRRHVPRGDARRGQDARAATTSGGWRPGAKADITVVDLSPLRTGPIDDPIRTMLMNANGGQVKTVIVDGRTVVEDGQIPGVDVEAMRRRAQAYFETYKAAYSERDYLRRPTDELFPPSFRTVERSTSLSS